MREDLLRLLKDIAYLQGKTLSQVLNEAVECYIEKMRAEDREALLKAREALEQLRKRREQASQASSPVNEVDEANGIEKGVVGVKNENDETVASFDPDFLNFVKGHNGMKLSFDEIYSVFLDREKTRRFVDWCVENGYCEVVKEGNTQKYRVIDRG
jgi:predicted DNA-binding protein